MGEGAQPGWGVHPRSGAIFEKFSHSAGLSAPDAPPRQLDGFDMSSNKALAMT